MATLTQPTLTDILLSEDARPTVEADCAALIEREVASKRGASGFMIKAGFKTVKAFKRNIVPDAVHHLLPDFVSTMEPFYAEHLAAGGGDVAAFASANAQRIAEALLGITDGRAAGSKHKTLVKAYTKLRPKGLESVVAAMPGIGAMLAKNGA